jgi:hypothetical protein
MDCDWSVNLTDCLLQNIDGVDYRKNIFLFLSNTGGKEITQTALDSWNRGKEREKISVMDLEHLSKLLCLMRSYMILLQLLLGLLMRRVVCSTAG